MKDNPVLKHNSIPLPYPPKGPFDYPLPKFGQPSGKANRAFWADSCQAFLYAGTTLYFWNESPDLKVALLSACSLKEDQSVFLIAKYGNESRLTAAIQSLLGKNGSFNIEEIGTQAAAALSKLKSKPGNGWQWNFDYLDTLPDGSLDRVILFNAASHVANWNDFARQIHRVLRENGRVIISDLLWGGDDFHYAMHMDAHMEGLIGKTLEGAGIPESKLPDITQKYLQKVFGPFLKWSIASPFDGMYLFYGQKGGKENSATFYAPKSTAPVRKFLSVSRSKDSWDFLAEPEKAIWGKAAFEITDMIKRDDHFKGMMFLGENLVWMWRNNRDITDVMFTNLMIKPGDRVLVIGEIVRPLGVMEELQKRLGETGKIAYWDLTADEVADYKDWPERRKKYMDMGGGEEWPYDFADGYPDEYFDAIFLPQGVHHSNNWLRDAPRLLRKLKPDCQFMAIECGVNRPEWFAARNASALVRLLIDRLFEFINSPKMNISSKEHLPPPPLIHHEGRPYHDVSTAHLREAFGDSLYDVNSLEWKGWILFWGYKK